MDFRTEIVVKPSSYRLSYQSEVISVGSCFADVIGQDLSANKFKVLANPLGIIYNPVSLFNSLLPFKYHEQDFIKRDGVWYYLHAHSELCNESRDILIKKIETKSQELQKALCSASHLVITLGTAWVYEYTKTKEVVANCHKLPADQFQKRLLSVNEIAASFEIFYSTIRKTNPNIHLVFTVSPVRHLKDTLPLNAVSKSTLRLLCHQLATAYPNVAYFPAYELLLDDLRDYRFYADDLLHPSPFASRYILQKFYQSFVDEPTANTMKQVQEIAVALQHRPFQPNSLVHQQFLKQTLVKAELLSHKVKMKAELEAIKSQITDL